MRRIQMQAPRGPAAHDCPPETDWYAVAAGTASQDAAGRLIAHAAGCSHCASLLKMAIHDLNDPLTAEESAVIERLRAPREIWGAPAAAPAPAPKPSWRWPVWAWIPVAVAAMLTTAVPVWYARRDTPERADHLLEAAATEQRYIEARFPGAAYGRYQAQRGPATMSAPSFLEANVIIGRKIESSPDDPAWIAERARADLLAGDYEAAVRGLNKALLASPNSPDLLMNVGIAHFERGEYDAAIQFLSKALTYRPRDPAALFNLALALERRPDPPAAIKAWEDYLQVEPNGGWADEARSRLSDLKQRQRR